MTITMTRCFQHLRPVRILHTLNTKLGLADSFHTRFAKCDPKVVTMNSSQNFSFSNDSLSDIRKQQYHSLRQQPMELLPSIQLSSLTFIRSFKMKMVLRKRCKDCYYTIEDGQPMILCRKHPRHKQKQILPPAKSKWILTHATQGTPRRW